MILSVSTLMCCYTDLNLFSYWSFVPTSSVFLLIHVPADPMFQSPLILCSYCSYVLLILLVPTVPIFLSPLNLCFYWSCVLLILLLCFDYCSLSVYHLHSPTDPTQFLLIQCSFVLADPIFLLILFYWSYVTPVVYLPILCFYLPIVHLYPLTRALILQDELDKWKQERPGVVGWIESMYYTFRLPHIKYFASVPFLILLEQGVVAPAC